MVRYGLQSMPTTIIYLIYYIILLFLFAGPLFVISYLYDQAQVMTSMGAAFSSYQPVQQDSSSERTTDGKTYMRELARLMNHTLTNVS